jgi:hypothetical protein
VIAGVECNFEKLTQVEHCTLGVLIFQLVCLARINVLLGLNLAVASFPHSPSVLRYKNSPLWPQPCCC